MCSFIRKSFLSIYVYNNKYTTRGERGTEFSTPPPPHFKILKLKEQILTEMHRNSK